MSSSGLLCRHPPKLASNAALDPDDHETYIFSFGLIIVQVFLARQTGVTTMKCATMCLMQATEWITGQHMRNVA